MSRGTGTAAPVPGDDLAGETSTAGGYREAGFVGYAGGFVAAVWVGKDDNSAMRRVSGGGAPARIWKDFMTSALPRLNAQQIPGGTIDPPPLTPAADPIGDLLDGVGGMIGSDPAPQPAAPTNPEPIPY